MKLVILLTVVICLQAAANGYAQTINLSLSDAKLEKVFSEIEKQTEYRFIYTKETLEKGKAISINVKGASIQAILDHCFNEQPLAYTIKNSYIIVRDKAITDKVIPIVESFTDIRGRVVNEKGEPVAGAAVQLKSSSIGAITDSKGEFELKGIEENAVLIISGAEFETKEIRLTNNSYLTIRLETKVSSLDQVLIMAYGETTKRLSTGSIAKVSAEEISKQPISNVLNAMQGRVPGLEIISSSGINGSSVKVQIRGRNSISQGTQPLFIIDGVPYAAGNGFLNQLPSAIGNPETTPANANGLSPFNFINPADIESIEILKDADATSIYGSRGANGVIIISTKKGKAGKTNVNVNFYTGFSRITRMMDLLNTQQYLEMRREAFANDNITPNPTNAPDLVVWDTTRYTDFKKMLIGGTANTTDAQVSFSGGNSNTQFQFSSGYHRESTVFPGDMYADRGSVHLNLKNSSENKKFNASFSFSYVNGKNNLSVSDLTSSINLPPNAPELYDSAGNLNWQEGGVAFNNPLAYTLTDYNAKTENLISYLQLEYLLLPGWKVRLSGGYNSTTTREERIVPIAAQNPANNPVGESWFANRFLSSWIIEPQTEYFRTIAKGRFNVLIGATFQALENEGTSIQSSGYTNDVLIRSISDAPNKIVNNSYKEYRYSAMFGRVNYNWRNKYILNITGRRDGSSRFGPANRFANFGSIGGAWIFSEEKFVKKNIGFISYGKIRGSHGTTGNDQITDYQYLDTWSGAPNAYQGSPGLIPTRLFNPNHQWEVNKKSEAAIDIGLLKDRVLFSVAYFYNQSDNQLIEYQLPYQTGFNSVTKNFEAIVQNTGIEVSINTINISSNSFKWQTSGNISFPRNKLVSFPGIENSSYANTYEVGYSLNLIKKYKLLGVGDSTGVYQFEDVNKDGSFNGANDFQVLGKTDADFYGGLGNSFIYKNWQLDLFIEFRKQTGRNYLRNIAGSVTPGRNVNQPIIVLERWQKPGDIREIQRFSAAAGTAANAAATRLSSSNGIYSDASFIRFKNLSIAYNLPKHLMEKMRLGTARIYLLAQNFLTITNYRGADPETQNIYTLPPMKTVALGIQLTF